MFAIVLTSILLATISQVVWSITRKEVLRGRYYNLFGRRIGHPRTLHQMLISPQMQGHSLTRGFTHLDCTFQKRQLFRLFELKGYWSAALSISLLICSLGSSSGRFLRSTHVIQQVTTEMLWTFIQVYFGAENMSDKVSDESQPYGDNAIDLLH